MTHRLIRTALVLLAVLALGASAGGAAPSAPAPAARISVQLTPGAKSTPHPLLMTLGGPIYCAQLRNLAALLGASLACTDYPKNGYVGPGGRANRKEDWGDPAYLAAAARVPDTLRRQGVKISSLVLVGVSYSGYANAELVATHPEMKPSALFVVDSYLDLPARFTALPSYHETRKEMVAVIGGTLQQLPAAYAARSPSHHLDGLARAIRGGMKLVVVWSIAPSEKREFVGATCYQAANAQWLSALAGLLGRPVVGYVTRLQHAFALWDHGSGLLALAHLASPAHPLPATAVTFTPGGPIPPGSYC
jgi:pimeloyl-ACP methyl ester carboxylesterase